MNYPKPIEPDEECFFLDDNECLVCGGEGFTDNPDPLWYGFNVEMVRCTSCNGSGLAKDMTYC